MKRIKFLFLLVCLHLFSYTDPEIENLLASLSDLYNPSLKDYRLIEHYYQHGDRPYLETMKKNTQVQDDIFNFRMKQLRDFKLVGPNGEMPILIIEALNIREETKDRCILICGSFNSHYPEKIKRLYQELMECGYSGHVMIRIGGIPNISEGGAKLSLIPYTWRINFFKEARRMGFTKILYLESTLHPLTDLSDIFNTIDSYGLFSCHIGPWPYNEFIEYIKRVGIPMESSSQIPWLAGHLCGLNFTHEKISQLFDRWDREIHRMDGFCSLGDDVLFNCLAWQLGFRASHSFFDIVQVHDFPPSTVPPNLILYQDNHKMAIREGWGLPHD